ncbi:MAG: type II toxin-antitoxin system YafQ family toxin [Oscillospiraceae bacterium]|nr:type II toxin-antitoxin system YafQ family toxin [Oscillospiraceae bacterium]
MLNVVLSNRFKKDLKIAAKRGCNLELLDDVVNTLADGEPLAEKLRDHSLTGDYVGFRECHIQPDWLLVYRIEDGDLILFLFRTGTHSDLFS